MWACRRLCAVCACRFPGRPEEVIRSLDTTGFADGCEHPDTGSENQTSAGAVKTFSN